MKKIIKKFLELGLWSSLDIQFADMIAQSSYPDEITNNNQYIKNKNALILASACLSAHVNLGHVCLPLQSLSLEKLFQGKYPQLSKEIHKKIGKLSIDNWKNLLLSSPATSNASSYLLSPLILEKERLYLHRMWKDECTIAKFFNYNNDCYHISQTKKIKNILNQLFPAHCSIPTITDLDWHKIATSICITRQKTLISGGPGTGKTSTIAKIVLALTSLHDNKLKIGMVAPTGKAAAFLTNSFQNALNKHEQLNKICKNTLPKKATTLHNLLRTCSHNNVQHNYHLDTLNLDLIIIDEASMISSSILAKLILKLPCYTKIIFFGDHNQLCSIEPGSAFKDICQFADLHYSYKYYQELTKLTGYKLQNTSPIPKSKSLRTHYDSIINGICILKKNYRFAENSGINQLANSIKSGNYDDAISLLNTNQKIDLCYQRIEKERDYINMLIHCATKYYQYFQELRSIKIFSTEKIINILKIFNTYKVLCATYHGPFGIIKLNYYIEQILHQKYLIQLNKSGYYIGKPIMILHNESSLDLCNGDIGVLLLDSKNKLSAYFLSYNNTIKNVQIYQLPKHETCFAITIHKAQGSEFQQITTILPLQHTSILTRELIYTAVTRARQKLFLYAVDAIIISSIKTVTQRDSGLYEKIKT